MTSTLAIDIGGTKIAYGIVPDDRPLTVIASGEVPSQPHGRKVTDQLSIAIEQAISKTSTMPARIGIGAPGVVRAPQGEIVYNGATIPGWAGTKLRSHIAKYLDAPVACHNDVRIWAYGEHKLGAGTDLTTGRTLYVSLGTGVGGAIIDDGELADGPTGSAGEISELVCEDFRGNADRVENIASGTSLARYYNVLTANPSATKIPWASPEPTAPALPEIIERAHCGDNLAKIIIAGNLRGLGRCLGAFASALDLNGVIIGGGLISIGKQIMTPIRHGFSEAALKPNIETPVSPSSLGKNAALIGAAAYAREKAY